MLTYSETAGGVLGAEGLRERGIKFPKQEVGLCWGCLLPEPWGKDTPCLRPLLPPPPTPAGPTLSPLNSMLTYSPGLLGSGGSGFSRTLGRVFAFDTSTNRLTGLLLVW